MPTIEGTKNVLIGTLPGFTTEDFSVGTGTNKWHLEAYIENAFDSHGELSRGTECGTADCAAHYRSFLIKPMNFGLKFGQKFCCNPASLLAGARSPTPCQSGHGSRPRC